MHIIYLREYLLLLQNIRLLLNFFELSNMHSSSQIRLKQKKIFYSYSKFKKCVHPY